jgi:hypothetical protein
MGRSFWVLDNVKPLQEIAQGLAGGATAATGLFTPREAYRVRYTPMGGGDPAEPNYPPAGANIDYYLASEPQGEVKLEILDASGKLVRSFSSEAPARQTGASTSATTGMTEEGGRFGQRALPSRLQKTPGMHRFVWDLRMGGGDAGRGGAAPLVLPGTYQVKFSAAATHETKPLDVKLDPRLALDGITLADLQVQQTLQLKLAEGMAAGRRAAARLREAREKLRGDAEVVRRLQALEARLVTGGGSYPQPMLIDQFANVARMLGQADQKVGKDAFLRYDDLKEQLDALLAEIERTLAPAAGGSS